MYIKIGSNVCLKVVGTLRVPDTNVRGAMNCPTTDGLLVIEFDHNRADKAFPQERSAIIEWF